MAAPLLTIIMGALNEEANIDGAMSDVLHTFDELGIAGELLVFNDGSTDRTGELVVRAMARDARIRLFTHATPHGIGASFWEGVTNAQGEFVTFLPGDHENDAREIMQYLP